MSTGPQPRKRFGQNFLQDQTVIDGIIAAIAPSDQDHLVEIGPGHGALTDTLANHCGRLDVIEIDRDLVPGLLAGHSLKPQFHLHNADALAFDFGSLPRGHGPLRIVGNLPYNISTPLIFKLLSHAEIIKDMHFMLQLEVVNRLAASPGSKAWGRLGVMAQYHCVVEPIIHVPPTAFFPAPKVESAVVKLSPRTAKPWANCDEAALRKVVKQSLAQRRKTLRNNLKGVIDAEALSALGIDPQVRAETLTIDEFIAIANAIKPPVTSV